MQPAQPTVLLVDDEEDIVDVYALAFDDEFTVLTAHDGEEALARVEDADVVLLDRRMPGLSGREVLAEIRARGVDVRVAMVTAVDPDFDIAEMAFDAYLTKPVREAELRATVEELLTLAAYDEQVRDRFAVAEKLAVLEAEKSPRELEESSEYQTLQERAATLDAESAETVQGMTAGTFEKALFEIDETDDGES
jgi:DNA-binding response OmpR family regulator